jgi:tetratricopeptide (TPR) repeat protein
LGRALDARVSVSLTVPSLDSNTLRTGLLIPARLELYGRAAAREAELIERYDAVSSALLQPAGQSIREQQKNIFNHTAMRRVVRAMEALDLYFEALSMFSGTWEDAATQNERMLRILKLDPESSLALNAYGETCLLLGRPQEALEAQNAALRLDSDFARAYHARGTAGLVLGLPVLAVADFSEAIRLYPANPVYRRDRAAAWLVSEEKIPMCRDFRDACTLGDCSGYQWAMDRGMCPEK